MTEGWHKLRMPRPRFSPSGPVPLPGPRTEPDTGEQFAGLAALIAIAERQDAARRAAAAPRPVPPPPRQNGVQQGDQLDTLAGEMETTQRKRPRRG